MNSFKEKKNIIQRGDIYWVKLDPTEGYETNKTRPAVVISNNEQNSKSEVVIVAPISSKVQRIYYTFQLPFYLKGELRKIKCEQIRAVGKHRLIGEKVDSLNKNDLLKLNLILKEVLALEE